MRSQAMRDDNKACLATSLTSPVTAAFIIMTATQSHAVLSTLQSAVPTTACHDHDVQVWHPDKHPENVVEAKQRFQEIQRAYDSPMTTDEDTRVETLGHK